MAIYLRMLSRKVFVLIKYSGCGMPLSWIYSCMYLQVNVLSATCLQCSGISVDCLLFFFAKIRSFLCKSSRYFCTVAVWIRSDLKNCMRRCFFSFLITLKCSIYIKIDGCHLFRFLCNLFSGSFLLDYESFITNIASLVSSPSRMPSSHSWNFTLGCNKWLSLSACDIWNGRTKWD